MPVPSPALYPSSTLYPEGLAGPVRDRPPLRLMLDIATPDGHHARWALDEHNPANVPSNLSFSSTMPGGFEQLSVTLPRKPGLDYADLTEFSTVTAYGVGGEIAWQGRLHTTPRTSGDQVSITPGAVGYQAALDDDNSARMLYVAASLTDWVPASVQRKLNLLGVGWDEDDPTVAPDQTTGVPSLLTQFAGAWARNHGCEAWYDAKGIPIGAVYYSVKRAGADPGGADTNWNWAVILTTDDVSTTEDHGANLRPSTPAIGSLTATASNRDWARAELIYTGAGGTDGQNYGVAWQLAVIGNHGLPIYTGNGAWSAAPCVLASDVIAHAVGKWAPELATSRAGQSTIEATTFKIPHLAFTDPGTASTILKAALAYEVMDWWVDDGPTFHLASRTNHGRYWRARVGPSGLQETGPQVDRMINKVMVAYSDIGGATRTVGPTGSGANTIDDSLADSDPTNPVNEAGLVRYPPQIPNIGVSTAAGAIAYGVRYLAEEKQASTSGQAAIVGHVQDDKGVWWPAWAIRAGDWISFTDAHDTSNRRIVKASYADSSKTCQLDLDSPAEDLDSLLARMSAQITALGLK